MTATIHYLRPFQREDRAEPAQAPEETPARDDETVEEEPQAKPDRRRTGGRAMPCGRDSKWKKKIGGGIAAREKRPGLPATDSDPLERD